MSEYISDTGPRPEPNDAEMDTDGDLLERIREDDSEQQYLNRAAHNNTDYAGIYDKRAVKFESGGGWDDLDSSRDTE